MKLPPQIVETALSYVGRKERPQHDNKGSEIQEFFDADNYDPNGASPGDSGYPWCAAFVDRVIEVSMEKCGVKETAGFKRPTTPGAWDLIRWSLEQDWTTKTIRPGNTEIKAGDILVLKVSHVAIAVTNADHHGYFETVEGNSNTDGSRDGYEVVHKTGEHRRHFTAVKSIIRFTV